ncbi:hypothetical protein [Labrenzia sp. OB1]|uniref:hypothetical protein n=1 Tax=Labrenzia sp. OB1 TaxID=1561204 RepID=UPI000AB69222|nr:hypothetical protein [Labrenzia sp. OB1]
MKIIFSVIAAFLAAYSAWEFSLYRHYLKFVPDAMDVWWVDYALEESWGFGPGGKEAGIIVFDMPVKTKQHLASGGLDWLENMPPNGRSGWQGRYRNWKSTPIPANEKWAAPENCSDSPESNGYHYNCPSVTRYLGALIRVDRDVAQMVDEAVFSSGAYYAYGRVGMIILIPERARIVYIYAG